MAELDFRTEEAVFDFLDEYSAARKEEIDRHKLRKDSGFIKSYSLETVSSDHTMRTQENLETLFRSAAWSLRSIGQNGLYRVTRGRDFVGFLEAISSRHYVLHTFNEAREMDRTLTSLVRETSSLDFIWIAGTYLNVIWETLVRDQMPFRFVTFKFEHQDKFHTDDMWRQASSDDLDNDYSFSDDLSEDDDRDVKFEHRASSFAVTHRAERVAEFLPSLQHILPDFKAIKMFRIPATSMPGGYDFWDWGKVTYRSSSFRDGRNYLRQITEFYQTTTEYIEERAWFQIERTNMSGVFESVSLSGTPITFLFSEPLDMRTFGNFVSTTFAKGQGPLRMWGEPIYLGEKKVHVHAIDLHLWKRIYFELTPSRFIAILPHGTCGNTIHRLVSNIQKYVSPSVRTYIGDYPYDELIRDTLLKKLRE